MRSRTSREFRRLLAALPEPARKRAAESYRLFQLDPNHPGIEFKRVRAPGDIYSARIGLGYRALAKRDGGLLVWFWIGTHADYDKLLREFSR